SGPPTSLPGTGGNVVGRGAVATGGLARQLRQAGGGVLQGARGQAMPSTATALAPPPPMHRAATPLPCPCLCMRASRVTRIRAPEAPSGCPSAQAPPCTLTERCGRPRSCMAAMLTTAKASLISNRPTSLLDQPTVASSVLIAATGAVVNRAGAWAAL